jgi:PAS domain S-box-containing protein
VGNGGDTHRGSEEFVRRVLDAVPGGVVHVDVGKVVLSANPEAARILAKPASFLVGRSVLDLGVEVIHEDGSPCPLEECPLGMALLHGTPQGPETLGFRQPDGSFLWATFRATPVPGPEDDLVGVIATFCDITELKLAAERLRASEKRWRALVESLPDRVLVVDLDRRIVSVNPRNDGGDERVATAPIIGASCDAFVDDTQLDDWQRAFAMAVSTRKPVRFEARAHSPAKGLAWYESILVPLEEGGEVERVMIVARDITERRAMLAGLAEKERLASIGMVAASVAHEIMNPLMYVLANLDLALGGRTLEQARRDQALAEAREGAKRVQRIVSDLRSLGRTGAEELFYVDARAILETALRLSGPEVGRTAHVVLELGEHLPGVLASESRLCQVFINLLVNAAQAMAERAPEERKIVVRSLHDEDAGLVGIAIRDTGPGIPTERLPRVFEPFYTTKPAGTGLGLSISRDIVERMGGRIAVESTVGSGATFTVWLPTTRRAVSSSSSSAMADATSEGSEVCEG